MKIKLELLKTEKFIFVPYNSTFPNDKYDNGWSEKWKK